MGDLVRLGDIDSGTAARAALTSVTSLVLNNPNPNLVNDPETDARLQGVVDRRLVAAVEDSAGKVALFLWTIDADGTFHPGPTPAAVGETTAVFSITTLVSERVVTALRQQNGNLRVMAWRVELAGTFTKLGTIDAGPVVRVAVTTAGPGRVVTATQDSSNATKLIVWDINSAGQFTRRGDNTAPSGTEVKVTMVDARRLVCAVRDDAGRLTLTAWSVDPVDGTIKNLGTAQGQTGSEIAITNTALDRVVTAQRLVGGTIQLDAWDLDGSGNLVHASTASAGAADELTLGALGSTKVFTAVRQADKTLKVISWQVIAGIQRLDSITAGVVSGIAAASLGFDRLVTAVQLASGVLRLIDWGDMSVSLLHGVWPIAPPAPSPPTSAHVEAARARTDNTALLTAEADDSRPPEFARSLEPGTSSIAALLEPIPPGGPPGPSDPPPPPGQPGPLGEVGASSPSPGPLIPGILPSLGFFLDPMIAVGHNAVIVCNGVTLEFLDKDGNHLTSVPDTPISVTSFFDSLLQVTNPDGSVNRNNINLHLRFPADTAAGRECPPAYGPVGPATDPPVTPGVNALYDARVSYDASLRRFVIIAAVRTQPPKNQPNPDPLSRRYVAIAVSNTEDPRFGFVQYMTAEPNYSDWPRLAASNGLTVIAHNAWKDSSSLNPKAYILRTLDLVTGQSHPASWKIYPFQVNGGTLYPVNHNGDTGGWTYLVKPAGSGVDIYGFHQTASTWTGWQRELATTSVAVPGGGPGVDGVTRSPIDGFTEGIHLRSNRLHLACTVLTAARVANKSPGRWMIRALRIPLTGDGQGHIHAAFPGAEALDFSFGLNAPGEDHPGDVFSYEMPSIAVNKNDTMIISFGRVPIGVVQPKGQEARYTVVYTDSRGRCLSRQLRVGELVLKDTWTGASSSHPAETTPVVENYWHVWGPGPLPTDLDQKDFLDYANAVVDPADDTTFWITHAFASASPTGLSLNNGRPPYQNGFQMVIGKIAP